MFKKTRKKPIRQTIQAAPELGFDYQIRFSQRKTAAIEIKNQTVTVAAPFGARTEELHQWVRHKRHWINDKLQQQNQRSEEIPQPQFSDGELWPFMGSQLTLKLLYNSRKQAQINNQTLHLSMSGSPETVTAEQVRKRLSRWYQHQAEEYMGPMTIRMARQIGQQVADIRFRRTKTKWGHCTSQGVIQYNWLIMMAPRNVIDYLIAHEVSHLCHPNHSSDFWQQVAEIAPDYATQRLWLKQNGHKFIM
ncbi:MAG: SprT family zinc-dependent metalloprotease [Candidatus Pelagadaptatus aseana]|uniref:M48 family metallopeptidase n=1 Tax=Candidatus Pelagadaptatus aseana TaxID=3120508 RepID=UPI0039B326D5